MPRVFYAPTNANRILVPKLARMERLRHLEFIPLSEDKQTRHGQLLAITGRAAYIWGDGTDHDDSYYFTRDSGVRLKGNVDHHPDTRDEAEFLNFDSHMTYAERDGVGIITPTVRLFPHNYRWETMKSAIQAIREKGAMLGENQMALTIDCDGILLFPAIPCYVYDYGFTAREIFEAVAELKAKLKRVDLGGVKKDLPDFEQIEIDLRKPPRLEMRFLTERKINLISIGQINLMGSYALMTYAGILDAFWQPN
ncbi:MAG: hypothetical protein ABII22_06845 [Candidatus Micrarchaeota archaeon]